MRVLYGLVASTLLVVLVACGVSQPPLPPSLHLPQPVQDLQASRKGDRVTLTWTVPDHSTDQEMLGEHLGITRVCREVAAQKISSCAQPVAVIDRKQLPAPQYDKNDQKLPLRATFIDALAKQLQLQNPTRLASYAVEVVNTNGRSAGLSNMVQIPFAPVPAPPAAVRAQVTADAVMLTFPVTWSDGTPRLGTGPTADGNVSNYRVYRSLKNANNFIALGFPQATDSALHFEDKTFEWETAYLYRITPVTWTTHNLEVEGEDSQPAEVFTRDVFPPAAPTGLQAVSSGTAKEKFIDLTWAPNTESDLAGYNLYRRTESGSWVRINTDLVTTPAFRDKNVEPGKTYIYAVSAVDQRKNESPKSPEATEFVP